MLVAALLLGAAAPAVDDGLGQKKNATLPQWNTTIPDASKPVAGLSLLDGTPPPAVVYRATPTIGTYNHGPMIVEHEGVFIVNWYAGQQDEDAPGERVLYSVSTTRGKTWGPPRPMFDRLVPTAPVGRPGITVGNEPFATIDGRLYVRIPANHSPLCRSASPTHSPSPSHQPAHPFCCGDRVWPVSTSAAPARPAGTEATAHPTERRSSSAASTTPAASARPPGCAPTYLSAKSSMSSSR